MVSLFCALAREPRGPVPVSRRDAVRYEFDFQMAALAAAAAPGGDRSSEADQQLRRVWVNVSGPVFRGRMWQTATEDARIKQLFAFIRSHLEVDGWPAKGRLELDISTETDGGAFDGKLPVLAEPVDLEAPFEVPAG